MYTGYMYIVCIHKDTDIMYIYLKKFESDYSYLLVHISVLLSIYLRITGPVIPALRMPD